VIPRDGYGPLLPGAADVSPATQELIDREVRTIANDAEERVRQLLETNRSRLDGLAGALLEHETLDEDDAYAAAGVTRSQALPVDELAAAARSVTGGRHVAIERPG
jgi:cell division protease FtsH